ncbi:Alpha/Beta hydrolase protein [Syncephalis plumigaleata]|nr:Alpha/Beta hydrolase protein [Syncephalis plumigaleata]
MMSIKGVFKVTDRSTGKPVQIAYEIHGNGPKHVVLLCGLNTSREWWILQADFLVKHDYQVLTIDNRGVGESDVPDGNYTIKSMSEDTVQLLDHLNWKSNNHVAGVSMGGMIGMQLASDYPGYVVSLCLVSTTAKWQPTPVPGALPRKLDPSNPQQDINMILIEYPKTWLEGRNKYNPRQTNREYILKLYQTRLSSSKPQTPQGYERQLWAVEHHELGENGLNRIAQANFPLLVCTGDQDPIIASSNSMYLAKRLRAPLELFKVCGHAICIQESDRFNALLLKHFCARK